MRFFIDLILRPTLSYDTMYMHSVAVFDT